ncbi:MAG: hypothetical protein APF77_22880 [Clostridia bacterium BRH_c25]|nr:MAG: hypothetical protein APF77_22880 [Clostridia bacterium BRH_c25]
MIQIDDAGSGSLVGGTCIGVLRKETGEYHYEIIPVHLFDEANFKNKTYIYYTTEIVKNAFKELSVKKKEKIFICQGYMFEDTRKYMSQANYNFSNSKIEEPLQSLIEKTFENYTISLGLPRDFITYTKYPFHFHRLLKWVYADYDNRIKLCKTGWKSWHKYSNIEVEVYYDKLLKSNFVCLKCGKKISDNSSVKVIKFFSNRNNYVYVHKHC